MSALYVVNAQVPSIQDSFSKQELYARYLKDTLNAANKIKELIAEASKDADRPDGRSMAIDKYQVALSLAPYARDSSRVLSILYANFSGILTDVGANDMSVQYAKKSLAYRRQYIYQPSAAMYNLLGRIASCYLKEQRYDSARLYFEKARVEAYGTHVPLWESSSENNIGFLLAQISMPDSAISHYVKAKKLLVFENRDEIHLLGSIQDNIATALFNTKQYMQAKDIFQTDEELYIKLKEPKEEIYSILNEARCLIAIGDGTNAQLLLQKAESIAIDNKSDRDVKLQLKMLSVWDDYYTQTGDWKEVATLQNKISKLNDSIANDKKIFLDKLINALTESQLSEARKGIQLYELQLSEARKKARTNLLIFLIIGFSGCCILILLIISFRNRIRIQTNKANLEHYKQELTQKELENKKLEQEKLEQELNYKKGDLHDLGIYLARLKDMHSSLTEKLTGLKKQQGDEQRETINHLINELDTQIYSQQRLEMINENIEQVNREFYDKLLKVYPTLTKSEVELCGFLKLNMSNKEISILKGTSGDTVKMARYRLRKKLGLQPDEDIYKAIASI